ncbi:MAG: carbohydrate ABC transporter permease [Anaerolineae bacterium]
MAALGQRVKSVSGTWRNWVEREGVLGYLLTSPALIVLIALIGYPFFVAIWLSLTNKTVGVPGEYVGLRNFRFLLNDEVFIQTAVNTFIYTGSAVLFKLLLGLALALVLNQTFLARNLFRGLLLLPWIIPSALSTLAWLWMFDALHGVINWALFELHLIRIPINWLGDPTLAKVATIVVNIWRGTPFFGISILAGLQSIPEEFYDAARTDGANPWQAFRFITVPMLNPILMVVTLFSLVQTFADFQIVYILTHGGPANSTHLFGTLSFQTALLNGRLGTGAAISLFIFPALAFLVFFELRRLREE